MKPELKKRLPYIGMTVVLFLGVAIFVYVSGRPKNYQLRLGVGLTFKFLVPFEPGEIVEENADVLKFQRDYSAMGGHALMLIPSKAGEAALAIQDKKGTLRFQLKVTAVDMPNDEVVNEMASLFERQNIRVSRRVCKTDETPNIVVGYSVGPIFLGNPLVVEFARRMEKDGDVRGLLIDCRRAGVTNIGIHDDRGILQDVFFFTVQ